MQYNQTTLQLKTNIMSIRHLMIYLIDGGTRQWKGIFILLLDLNNQVSSTSQNSNKRHLKRTKREEKLTAINYKAAFRDTKLLAASIVKEAVRFSKAFW